MSLFNARNQGSDSSSSLLASIHILCSHSFVAVSASSPPFVNIPISPRTARALSISSAVGFGFVINSRSAFTFSVFPALGIILSFVTFAKFGKTSVSACCNSCTVELDSYVLATPFSTSLANNATFFFPASFAIADNCFCIVSFDHFNHLSSIHCGASSAFIIPSSESLESRSEAFSNLEGVISPELMSDFGILSVISFFTFHNPAHTIGSAQPTSPPVTASETLVFHLSAIPIPTDCNAPSPAPARTLLPSPAPFQSNPVGQGTASIAPAPPIIFPVVTHALYA